MSEQGALPGAELIDDGLRDLAAGVCSVAALVVAVGAPRLQGLGIGVPDLATGWDHPEHRLYALLAADGSDGAHGRYQALIRRLVSFERALAAQRGRELRARGT